MHGYSHMSIDWDSKFQSVGLTEDDCKGILQTIESGQDAHRLSSLLYMYGYSCKPHLTIIRICDKYIKNPVPGLTAVCLKVLADYWSMWNNYNNEIEGYLNIELFDVWYDEVIFSVNFVIDNANNFSFPDRWISKAKAIKDDPFLSRQGLI